MIRSLAYRTSQLRRAPSRFSLESSTQRARSRSRSRRRPKALLCILEVKYSETFLFLGAGVVQYRKEIQRFLFEAYIEQRVDCVNVSGIFLLPPQCYNRFSSIRGTTLATWPKCGAQDYQLSLPLYKANLSLLRHASS